MKSIGTIIGDNNNINIDAEKNKIFLSAPTFLLKLILQQFIIN